MATALTPGYVYLIEDNTAAAAANTWAADPENIDARKLRIRMLKKLGSRDYCLMSRNAWVYFIKKDKKFIRSRL